MKIGLLSDTHGYLDPAVFIHFNNCDEIWHAGDLGSDEIITNLERFKPLRAVFGNIDTLPVQKRFPEDNWFTCEGLKIWITHIGGKPPSYNSRIKKMLKENVPDIFICGHSHILKVQRDPNYKKMIYMNPGAAGNQGLHSIKTMLRFEIVKSEIRNLEVIELGKRGALKT